MHIDLPTIGNEVNIEEVVGAVESVKAVSDVYSPVTGIVTKVNERLEDEPELLNSSPEDEGWIYEIELEKTEELEKLLDPAAYGEWCAKEEEH